MTTEHDYLAKVCFNIIRAQSLNTEQEILVGAKLMGLLASPSAPTEGSSPKNTLPQEKEAQHTVPPSTPKHSPDPKPVKVIAKKGLSCSCSACNKVVYQLVSDLTDPMPTSAFIEAFGPVGHDKGLTPKSRINNINGNVATDCPLCEGQFTLWLIGKSSPNDTVTLPDSDDMIWE